MRRRRGGDGSGQGGRARRALAGLAVCAGLLVPGLAAAQAGHHARGPHGTADRYDETFRKYSKRYFGPDYDWRVFKAQGMVESNLDSAAHSRVGARGVMQLMPTTFREIASHNPEIRHAINCPEWNIAAGISYDRRLWQQWEADSVTLHRREFMFASYNAGRATILGAQSAARARRLDERSWPSIETVAPSVPRWRWRETVGYVHRIDGHLSQLDDRGRLVVTRP
jgi:membrane-bound lytic murein transglycosylase F